MLDAGLLCTVNSDDPAYFGGYVGENILAVQEALQLTRDDIIRLQRNAIEASWAPPAVKDRISAELDALT